MKIVLLGFMGAGKTSVSQLLATTLDIPAIDMDEEIVKRSGCETVSTIFEKLGEAGFRQLEKETAAWIEEEAAQDSIRLIVSTGGGVVESEDSMNALSSAPAVVIYLHASFETIQKRLVGDTTRPLFKDEAATLKRYEMRLPLYQKWSDITVETDTLSTDEIVAFLVERLAA